jgi:6-phosphogluconolactonase
MELVHGPIAELKTLLTQSFEQWVAENMAGSVALSGGATALIFLPALLAAKVDWSTMTLFWADERAVDVDDPESNYGLAQRMLLTPLGRKGPRALPMSFELPSLPAAAQNYDSVLARELGGRPLDLAIVGVGDDGHVCGLFPGHRALLEDTSRVVAIDDAPRHPKRRLSLTMRYLLQTQNIWIVAVGQRKLPALQAALTRTQQSTPLDLLLQQQSKRISVFTDQVIRSASTSRRV